VADGNNIKNQNAKMTYKEEIVGVGRDSMWIPAPVRDKFRRNDKSNKTLYFRYADFSVNSRSF